MIANCLLALPLPQWFSAPWQRLWNGLYAHEGFATSFTTLMTSYCWVPLTLTSVSRALHTLLLVCQEFGIPMTVHKVEGPCTRLIFLGPELDTSNMSLTLPRDKLFKLRHLLARWLHAKCVQDLSNSNPDWTASPCNPSISCSVLVAIFLSLSSLR